MENYSDVSHINVGTGVDLSIRELAEKIRDMVYPEAELQFDTSKPDGTPRKVLDVTPSRRNRMVREDRSRHRASRDLPMVPRPGSRQHRHARHRQPRRSEYLTSQSVRALRAPGNRRVSKKGEAPKTDLSVRSLS